MFVHTQRNNKKNRPKPRLFAGLLTENLDRAQCADIYSLTDAHTHTNLFTSAAAAAPLKWACGQFGDAGPAMRSGILRRTTTHLFELQGFRTLELVDGCWR